MVSRPTRLGMTAPLSEDVLDVLRTRVFDIAACTGKNRSISVSIDGKKIPIKSVKDYAAALGGEIIGRDAHIVDSLQSIEISVSRADDRNPACVVGFVNGIRCSSGKHIDFVWKRIVDMLGQVLTKRLKRPITVKLNELREHIILSSTL